MDLAERVEALDSNFPGAPRKTTKRDVNEAFKRVATLCALNFPGSELGLLYDVIFFWIALPLGWSASPGYFQTCDRLITKLHCAYRPLSPSAGNFSFVSHMFVDEAMLIDVDFPDRLDQSANEWGHSCDMVLGTGSVSMKKNGG